MADGIPSDGGAASGGRIGELLAAERKRLGFTVEQAAEALRLRAVYLEAIEQSRLEDLPGLTYASGFVRAYAEYLGLDGPDIIRRFKSETGTLTRPTTLSFPAPVSEGRVPSRAILTASAVVGIFIYALWHFFASGERGVVEAVPQVPAQFGQAAPESPLQGETSDSAAEVDEGTANAQGPAPAQAPALTVAPGLVPAPTLGPVATQGPISAQGPVLPSPLEAFPPPLLQAPALGPAATKPPAQAKPPVPAKIPEQATAPTPAQVKTPGPATAPAPTQAQASAQAQSQAGVALPVGAGALSAPQPVPSKTPAPAVKPPAKVEPGAESGTTSAPAVQSAPATPGSTAGQGAPIATASQGAPAAAVQSAPVVLKRPAGIDAGESRIVLRANADSWIEIQDDGGSVLLRQILRAGESYRVPNRAGLSLMTGNAGGIEVSVDGKPGRKMGPSGIARRNIPLDPDQLQSGAIID